MRASADRPLSALVAIVATILFFGLLAFLVGKYGPDDGLTAHAGDPTPVSAAQAE